MAIHAAPHASMTRLISYLQRDALKSTGCVNSCGSVPRGPVVTPALLHCNQHVRTISFFTILFNSFGVRGVRGSVFYGFRHHALAGRIFCKLCVRWLFAPLFLWNEPAKEKCFKDHSQFLAD